MHRDVSKDVVVVLLVLTVLVSVIGLWSVSNTINGLEITFPETKEKQEASPQGMVILGTLETSSNDNGQVTFEIGETEQ